MLVNIYNALKALWSRGNDWVKAPEPRSPVPAFKTPEEAAGYLVVNVPYTGDPLKGAADFYLHPERLQAAIERGYVARLSIDCDDIATFAYLATRNTGRRQLYTLIDGDGWMHHVICTGEDSTGPWAIDTNGFRRLPDLSENTLLETWTGIYASMGARYVKAVATPYPF